MIFYAIWCFINIREPYWVILRSAQVTSLKIVLMRCDLFANVKMGSDWRSMGPLHMIGGVWAFQTELLLFYFLEVLSSGPTDMQKPRENNVSFSRAGFGKLFIRDQILKILAFAGLMVSVAPMHCGHSSAKAAITISK